MLTRRLWLAILTASVLVLGACGGDGGGSNDEPEDEASAEFTTGDLESLTLGTTDVPGLELTAERSGPTTARQSASGLTDIVQRLEDGGYVLGWVQRFDATEEVDGVPKPNDMGVVVVGSRASIYEDADGAGQSVSNPEPPPNSSGYESEPIEGLGDEAIRAEYTQNTNWGPAETINYTWRVSNATVTLTGIGSTPDVPVDEEALLEMAKALAEGTKPTGAPEIEVPEIPADGEVLLEDDFSDPKWAPQDYGQEAYSNSQDGAWLMHVESLGLWNSSDEFGDPKLTDLSDMRVEFTAKPTGANEQARIGGVCRADTETNRAYSAFVGTDGTLGITKATSEVSSPLVVSPLDTAPELNPEGDRYRIECAGDELVYVALYLNDELVVDAIDDEPFPPAGGGMFVEAVTETAPIPIAEVLFDDLVLTGSKG